MMQGRGWFRLSIAWILTLSMVFVVATLMVVTTLLDIRRANTLFQNEMQEHGFLLANTLNDVLADSLYFVDIDKIYDIAVIVSGQPGIVYVQVIGPDGEILVDTRQGKYSVGTVEDGWVLRALHGRDIASRVGDDRLEVTTAIQTGTQLVGGVRIAFSQTPLHGSIRALGLERLRQGIALLIVAVVLASSLAQYFTRPLSRLVKGTQRVAKGDYDFEAAGGEVGEIGELAVAFDEMTKALRTSRTTLEERSSELRAAYEQLLSESTEREKLEQQFLQAQKFEAMGQLAGGVAHDFNNLLTPILGYTQLAMKKAPPSEWRLRDDLQEVQRAAESASQLTTQLLTFSRHQVIEPRVIDVNALTLDMDRMLRRLIGEDIELVTILAPETWPVKADSGQMQQVLVNLAVNARDAMPRGGKLIIETSNVVIDAATPKAPSSVRPRKHVLLAVRDTGVGMTPEVKSRIFEPFFTTKEEGRGTGLGLSTCYGIVAQTGGHISVESDPGSGATFRIYLPKATGSTVIRLEKMDPKTSAGGVEKVLLVEDEPSVRRISSRVLREQGYAVLEAANGVQALSLAKQDSNRDLRLLLTDVVMPLMDGTELATQLKATLPDIRVLFVSGYTDDRIDRLDSLASGTGFVAKPFTPDALANKVREMLDS